MKDFNLVLFESTCQKRIVVCELYDIDGNLLARESNRCDPSGGTCHRLGATQSKESYDVESECNWTHAEIMALNSLAKDAKPYKSIIYGHEFYCPTCEAALKKAGVQILEVK